MPVSQMLITLCWWLLAVLQLAWHGLLPPPLGNSNWLLAMVAVIPLLLMAPIALRRGVRGRFWGMFLVMLYFVIAVTESWSNDKQRVLAVIQLVLSLGYFGGMVWISRSAESRP
ncbi:MAG: DUF2069 domain-containing protein [Xanthomonadales bacterium]|nr:DUF2069 domain-containing protein [Xanthomonadales bacterium]